MGHVKFAFVLAFYCLWHADKKTYEEQIEFVVGLGGDTDTNACITGGLIGAYYGLTELPVDMLQKLQKSDLKKGSKPNRPAFCHPSTFQ
jgi:ADP-ribosylglycohydrolase